MGGDGDSPGGHDGGKLLAVHRELAGKGPLSWYGLSDKLIREMGCTPSEAVHELQSNPHLRRQLQYAEYRAAYLAVERWLAMTQEQRAQATEPRGRYVTLVHRHRRLILESDFTERDAALATEGRD